jgi:hypothetical protein
VVKALRYKPEGLMSRPDDGNDFFFTVPNPSEALGFNQLLTEISTRSRKITFLGSRAQPVHTADNLTAICEPIVYTMWDPQHLTAL